MLSLNIEAFASPPQYSTAHPDYFQLTAHTVETHERCSYMQIDGPSNALPGTFIQEFAPATALHKILVMHLQSNKGASSGLHQTQF
jgi:hypothetical protein